MNRPMQRLQHLCLAFRQAFGVHMLIVMLMTAGCRQRRPDTSHPRLPSAPPPGYVQPREEAHSLCRNMKPFDFTCAYFQSLKRNRELAHRQCIQKQDSRCCVMADILKEMHQGIGDTLAKSTLRISQSTFMNLVRYGSSRWVDNIQRAALVRDPWGDVRRIIRKTEKIEYSNKRLQRLCETTPLYCAFRAVKTFRASNGLSLGGIGKRYRDSPYLLIWLSVLITKYLQNAPYTEVMKNLCITHKVHAACLLKESPKNNAATPYTCPEEVGRLYQTSFSMAGQGALRSACPRETTLLVIHQLSKDNNILTCNNVH